MPFRDTLAGKSCVFMDKVLMPKIQSFHKDTLNTFLLYKEKKRMRLVWMIIMLTTGAMFFIAATLVVRPMDSGEYPTYSSLKAVYESTLCFYCGK